MRVVNVPSTKHPFNCLLLAAMLCRAVSRATFSLGAGVWMIVDQRASTGRLYVPSVKVGSSKNAALIASSSGSSPSLIRFCRKFSTPSSNFSPMKRKNTSVSIISRFSKNDPELRALRRISRHLNRIASRLIFSSTFFLAIEIYLSLSFRHQLHLFSDTDQRFT